MLKTYIKLGVPVLLTCIIASALLGAVYSVTKDPILRQDEEARNRSLRAVLPSAVTFKDVTSQVETAAVAASGDLARFDFAYQGLDKSGSPVGWGLVVAPRGYGGYIQMVVAVDRNGKVTAVTIVSHKETPGLGTKATNNPQFLERFYGLDAGQGADGGAKVDTIMGATKSSRGIKHGVQAAMEVYAKTLVGMGR